MWVWHHDLHSSLLDLYTSTLKQVNNEYIITIINNNIM